MEIATASGSDVFGFDIPVQSKKRRTAFEDEDPLQAELDEYRFLIQAPIKVSAAEFWLRHDAVSFLTVIALYPYSPSSCFCPLSAYLKTCLEASNAGADRTQCPRCPGRIVFR